MLISSWLVQLSVAVAVPVAAGELSASQSTVTSAGQVIAGTILSVTVTVKLHWSWLPAASFAVYVIVVTPVLNVLIPTWFMPAAGEFAVVAPVIVQVSVVTAQLSV